MMSKPINDQDSVYAETIRRIHIVCREKTDKQLAVFRGKRKTSEEEVWLLAIVDHLTEDGKLTPDSSFSIMAEFMPDKPIDQLYDLLDFFVANVTKVSVPELPPLPKNVFQFDKNRKKK
jgi:hypothetical protein